MKLKPLLSFHERCRWLNTIRAWRDDVTRTDCFAEPTKTLLDEQGRRRYRGLRERWAKDMRASMWFKEDGA